MQNQSGTHRSSNQASRSLLNFTFFSDKALTNANGHKNVGRSMSYLWKVANKLLQSLMYRRVSYLYSRILELLVKSRSRSWKTFRKKLDSWPRSRSESPFYAWTFLNLQCNSSMCSWSTSGTRRSVSIGLRSFLNIIIHVSILLLMLNLKKAHRPMCRIKQAIMQINEQYLASSKLLKLLFASFLRNDLFDLNFSHVL